MCQVGMLSQTIRTGGSKMELSVIGMDIAKNVFQLHCVDRQTGEIERIKLRRNEVLPRFARRTPAVVAMEACGGWSPLVGAPIAATGSYRQIAPCQRSATVCAAQQDRCSGCTRYLDGGAATRNEDRCDQDRISAKHSGLASNASSTA